MFNVYPVLNPFLGKRSVLPVKWKGQDCLPSVWRLQNGTWEILSQGWKQCKSLFPASQVTGEECSCSVNEKRWYQHTLSYGCLLHLFPSWKKGVLGTACRIPAALHFYHLLFLYYYYCCYYLVHVKLLLKCWLWDLKSLFLEGQNFHRSEPRVGNWDLFNGWSSFSLSQASEGHWLFGYEDVWTC